MKTTNNTLTVKMSKTGIKGTAARNEYSRLAMSKAWEIARELKAKFGGTCMSYFSKALAKAYDILRQENIMVVEVKENEVETAETIIIEETVIEGIATVTKEIEVVKVQQINPIMETKEVQDTKEIEVDKVVKVDKVDSIDVKSFKVNKVVKPTKRNLFSNKGIRKNIILSHKKYDIF